MKPFVAFPLVPFINHFPPLATSNTETILRSRGTTTLLHPPPRTWTTCPTSSVHLIPLFLSLSAMNSRYVSSTSKGRRPSPFLLRRLGRRILITEWLCLPPTPPREISLSSCGDRIALTKSSKGGVKAPLARAKKGKIEGDKVHLAGLILLPPPFLPHPFSLDRMGGEWREKGNSIFHG